MSAKGKALHVKQDDPLQATSLFFRLLDVEPRQKAEELRARVSAARSSTGSIPDTSVVPARLFKHYPKSAWVYDLPQPVVRAFAEGDRVPRLYFEAHRGLGAANSAQLFRARWEVEPLDIGINSKWVPFNNGGPFSPFFYSPPYVVLKGDAWEAFSSYDTAALTSSDLYGQRGLMGYGKRTDLMYGYPLPEGFAFSVEGQAIEPITSDPMTALAIVNSTLFGDVVNRFTAQHKYHGYINAIAFPRLSDSAKDRCARVAETIVSLLMTIDACNETSMSFEGPLVGGLGEHAGVIRECLGRVRDAHGEVDEIVESDVGLVEELATVRGSQRVDYEETYFGLRDNDGGLGAGNLFQWAVGVAFGRWDVRMVRDEELLPGRREVFAPLPRLAPATLIGPDGRPAVERRIASEKWLRARKDATTFPEEGMYDGPPSITAGEYPISVGWDGILVDDPGHDGDVVGKVREVLGWAYGDRAQAIEEEALELLRGDGRTPRTLRDWFRNQRATELGKNFFDFHIQRYSKGRRKAPIYWRLCSSPGRGQSEYGVWLYYHRLGDDTLWKVIDEYVVPRRELEERRLRELRAERADAQGSAARRIEARMEESSDLLEELTWFEAELRKVAERGWAPDLDDGVVVNLAPLHAVVPWKESEKIWKRLEAGEYDWAHLAMRYWPERVEEKCRSDRSLAVAHGVEELFEDE